MGHINFTIDHLAQLLRFNTEHLMFESLSATRKKLGLDLIQAKLIEFQSNNNNCNFIYVTEHGKNVIMQLELTFNNAANIE